MLVRMFVLGVVGLLLSSDFGGKAGSCKQKLRLLQNCSKHDVVLHRYIWTGFLCRRVAICSNSNDLSSTFTSASKCKMSCSTSTSSKSVQGRRLARHTNPTDASVCGLPLGNHPEDCIPDFPVHDHFYFNTEKQECMSFHFFNCQINNNDFTTREACENLCLPLATSQSSSPESTATYSPGTEYPQPSATIWEPTAVQPTQVHTLVMTSVQELTTATQQLHSQKLIISSTIGPVTTNLKRTMDVYIEASVMVVAMLLMLLIVIAVVLGAAVVWRRNKARLTPIIMEREQPVVLAYFNVTKPAAVTDQSDDKATKLPSISIT